MNGTGGRKVPDWLKGKPARITIILLVALVAWVLWSQFFPELDLQELLDRFAEFLGPWTYLVVGILAFTAVALLNQALATIFGVALYHYAASDKAVGVFTTEDFAEAVTVKGGMPPGMANTTI